jgi:hypothetical protein
MTSMRYFFVLLCSVVLFGCGPSHTEVLVDKMVSNFTLIAILFAIFIIILVVIKIVKR